MRRSLFIAIISVFFIIVYSNIFTQSGDMKILGADSIPQLIEAASLIDPDAMTIKIDAINRLGELQAREAVPALIDALGYGSETLLREGGGRVIQTGYVRIAASEALAKINDERSVNALVRRVLEDEDRIVRKAAIRSLGKMGETARTKYVLTVLHDLIERTKDNSLAYEVCSTLGEIGDKSSFVYLIKVTQGSFLNTVKESARKSIAKTKWEKPSVFEVETKPIEAGEIKTEYSK